MSDQITEHTNDSLENTVINPHPQTGVEYKNEELKAAESLDQAAAPLGGTAHGPATSVSNLGTMNHNQFEQPAPAPKIDPATLTPEHRKKSSVTDTVRWFAEKVHGRKRFNQQEVMKNAA
jgi:hypothetical protein